MAAKAHELPQDFLTGDPKTVIALNRPRRTPVATASVSVASAAETSQPLTPWQQKEAFKLLRAAASVVGDAVEDPVVTASSVRAVVLREHSEVIANAIAGIEDSDFALANDFRSSIALS